MRTEGATVLSVDGARVHHWGAQRCDRVSVSLRRGDALLYPHLDHDFIVGLCFGFRARWVSHDRAAKAYDGGAIDRRIGDSMTKEQLKRINGLNKSGVQSYSIHEASDMIDYEVLYTRTDWRDPAIQQRLAQAEKCEILVPGFIPLELIRNFPNG
jgi:hypothetical protein